MGVVLQFRRWISLHEVVQLLIDRQIWFLRQDPPEVQGDSDPDMVVWSDFAAPSKKSRPPRPTSTASFQKKLRSLRYECECAHSASGDGSILLRGFLTSQRVKTKKRDKQWGIASNELERAVAEEETYRKTHEDEAAASRAKDQRLAD